MIYNSIAIFSTHPRHVMTLQEFDYYNKLTITKNILLIFIIDNFLLQLMFEGRKKLNYEDRLFDLNVEGCIERPN